MSIRIADTIIAGGGMPINKSALTIFDFKWSDHLQNDISWLRADTFSWQPGNTYKLAYQHLQEEYAAQTSTESETIGGTSITFKRAADGHKIVDETQETAVATIFANTGVAWYYILDVTNKRFKLPRTQFNVVGLRDNAGNYVAPGLPNITGEFTTLVNNNHAKTATGVFGGTGRALSSYPASANISANVGSPAPTATDIYGYNIDASRSSPIYGNTSTVQSPAVQMYLYFYVGEFTQTAQYNTAGLNAESINAKADDSSVVHKGGEEETITGFKNFQSNKYGINSAFTDPNIDIDIVPTDANKYAGLQFNDKNGKRIGKLEIVQDTQGQSYLQFNTHKIVNGVSNHSNIACRFTDAGVAYAIAPTTPTSATGQEIVTANFIRNLLNGMDYVVSYAAPTSANGWRWYRKYKSGWVEQGGTNVTINERATVTINLLIAMAHTGYTALAQNNSLSTADDAENGVGIEKTSTTQIKLFTHYINPNTISVSWMISGQGA